jgi:peptidase E
MKYYLLSGMDEENEYNFFENIADRFRKDLKSFDTIIYIPTYPENKEKCIKLSKSEKFKNIGIDFNKSIVLDYSYSIEDVKNIIDENKLIFLYGGDPYKQMEFITKYGIKDLIKDKNIIGLSAGSINMCKKAICTKDEDFEKSTIYNGMGLIDFSIEPHFDINNIEVLEDLKKFSKDTGIYALEDNAYIIVENNKLNFYRKCVFYKKWKYKKNRTRVTSEGYSY